MSNVIRFPTSISDDEAMRLEMVEALQHMLALAESGELKALLLASVSIPGDNADDMRIESWTFDGKHTPLLIGVGSWAVHRLNMRMEYTDDE
jgi:hypothetical protein